MVAVPIRRHNYKAELLSGSVNVQGALEVEALRPEAASQYEQIVTLVHDAPPSFIPVRGREEVRKGGFPGPITRTSTHGSMDLAGPSSHAPP